MATITSVQKRCFGCREELPLDAFPRNRSRPDGHHDYCRPCWSEYRKRYDRNRLLTQARTEALTALSMRYPNAYARLLREAKRKRGI